MIVAVDARELTGRPTGVGRYLGELLAEWAQSADAMRHDWRVYAQASASVPAAFAAAVEVVPGGGGTRWEQWSLARALSRARPDVLFAPGYTAPLTAPCPTVLTVHDVSFAAHPEWFTAREGLRRRVLTAWSARRARLVLTDSEFSRREITHHLGVPESRVRVIPLGMRVSRAPAAATPREPIVLFVGSIFRRRHVDHLIRVFAREVAAQVPDSRLEIVGELRAHPPLDLARELREVPGGIRARISVRSYVDDATLAALYRRASVFVFLSEYEGFGLTPLEALAAGVPPVVLDTPIAREVYGAAARYVELGGAGAAMVDLLQRAPARADVLQHAGAVLARYDWARTAAATLAAIREGAGA
jgi:glycosyltransferase involved in cell wall biosynthesis